MTWEKPEYEDSEAQSDRSVDSKAITDVLALFTLFGCNKELICLEAP